MSAPEQVHLEKPDIEQRGVRCAGCAHDFIQSRLRLHLGRGWSKWSPEKCAMCATKEAGELAALGEEQARRERLRKLNIPTRYAAAQLVDFRPHGTEENRQRINRVCILARRFLSEWPRVKQELLVFRGGPGTGKGHVAWAVAREVAGNLAASVLFVKLPELVRDLRSSWGRREGPSEEERLKRYRKPQLLVVDEVSRHAFYGEPTRHLYDVLDDRCDWCKPTILTTNETVDGLGELLGPALLDRVSGYGGLVEFGNESYRARDRGEP